MNELSRAVVGFVGIFGGIALFDAGHEFMAALFFLNATLAIYLEEKRG